MMQNIQEPESMGSLLALTCRLHFSRVHELLEKIGLYRGQPPMLHALWEQEGLSHTELATLLQISPATTTKMIQRMERAGFIQRKSDPQDQRLSRVYLTEAGRVIRSEVEAIWLHIEAETFAGFSIEEKESLRNFFLRIQNNLSKGKSET
jgi:DNA-binding MarR family transcriptional regulator